MKKSWTTYAEGFRAYEDGKHRRYNLLFAVNGAAFALAKFMTERAEGTALLGHLTLVHVALGMIVFSALMTADIYMFGDKMSDLEDVFGGPGRAVLVLIGALLCVAWLLVIV